MMTNLYKEHRIKCTIVVYDILTLTSSVGLYIVAMQSVAPWDSCEPLHHMFRVEQPHTALQDPARCRSDSYLPRSREDNALA